MTAQPEYLTLDEGARLLRFDQTAPKSVVRAFRQWLRRNGVPVLKRGRTLLIDRRVLDAYVRGDQWTLRRRSA